MKAKFLRFLLIFICCCTSVAGKSAVAEGENTSLNPDSLDEDFVIASVLVASPGSAVYSVFGHTALRLECPVHQLDYVFSYENEEHGFMELRFLAGVTHGRTACVPTSHFIQNYASEGRGVEQYRLNLPIAVKQRLWQIMDNHAMEAETKYDFYDQSCGRKVYHWLREASGENALFTSNSAYFQPTSYELCAVQADDVWNRWALMTLFQGQTQSEDVQQSAKVRTPQDLLEVLKMTTYNGKPILSSTPEQVQPRTYYYRSTWIPSPEVLACALLLLALLNLYLRNVYLRVGLLLPMLALGTMALYLVIYRPFVGAEWNWLVIPFSPIPFLLWRWRRWWTLPMAAVCLLWAVGTLLPEHQIVHESAFPLAVAMAMVDIEIFMKPKQIIK